METIDIEPSTIESVSSLNSDQWRKPELKFGNKLVDDIVGQLEPSILDEIVAEITKDMAEEKEMLTQRANRLKEAQKDEQQLQLIVYHNSIYDDKDNKSNQEQLAIDVAKADEIWSDFEQKFLEDSFRAGDIGPLSASSSSSKLTTQIQPADSFGSSRFSQSDSLRASFGSSSRVNMAEFMEPPRGDNLQDNLTSGQEMSLAKSKSKFLPVVFEQGESSKSSGDQRINLAPTSNFYGYPLPLPPARQASLSSSKNSLKIANLQDKKSNEIEIESLNEDSWRYLHRKIFYTINWHDTKNVIKLGDAKGEQVFEDLLKLQEIYESLNKRSNDTRHAIVNRLLSHSQVNIHKCKRDSLDNFTREEHYFSPYRKTVGVYINWCRQKQLDFCLSYFETLIWDAYDSRVSKNEKREVAQLHKQVSRLMTNLQRANSYMFVDSKLVTMAVLNHVNHHMSPSLDINTSNQIVSNELMISQSVSMVRGKRGKPLIKFIFERYIIAPCSRYWLSMHDSMHMLSYYLYNGESEKLLHEKLRPQTKDLMARAEICKPILVNRYQLERYVIREISFPYGTSDSLLKKITNSLVKSVKQCFAPSSCKQIN